MQSVIIGTAGHVDHGKTCLIKALTGVDTDRLIEEKKRGITIELGFASLPNDQDIRIGIIDVPGHERFVHNMLAGIGGIDLVLMIVGLDEGVMPQTREHFEILKMLHIKKGILVFTKADLVDEDWAEMVEEDAKELVKGSFLEDAPCIRVSAFTGFNIEKLKEMILENVKDTAARRTAPELFRLPIDRVFSMEGFGTVVTGTLIEGSCTAGEDVMLYPEGRTVRIRGLQNHNEKEDAAEAGQRTALNLALKKEDLERGEVLAAPGSLIPGLMADAKVQLFSDTERRLKNNSTVHISFGASQKLAKAVLLDKDEIGPGEEAYVQFRFKEPVVMKHGDRFIIRFYSPVETFGGGVFLEAAALKHRRNREDVIEGLHIRENGTEEERAEEELRTFGSFFPEVKELAVRLNLTEAAAGAIFENLKKKKRVISAGEKWYLHKSQWERISSFSEETLKEFHRKNPILAGMEKAELKSRIGQEFHADAVMQELLLKELIKRKIITSDESSVALAGFSSSFEGESLRIRSEIEETFRTAGIAVPSNNELAARFGDRQKVKQILADLQKQGTLVKVNPDYYMESSAWEYALGVAREKLDRDGSMTLAEFRDLLGTTRKYSMMLLESYDSRRYTKMAGEARVKARDF